MMSKAAIESVKELITYPEGYATPEEKVVFAYIQEMLDGELDSLRDQGGARD